MEKRIILSIIIPMYNSGAFIKSCIESIKRIKSNKIECIIVNDGSTDDSIKIVEEIKDERMIVVDKTNGGVSTARNLGVEYAKGDFITFIDSDDVVDSDKLQYVVEGLTGEYDLIYYSRDYTDTDMQPEVLVNGVFGIGDTVPVNGSAPHSKIFKRVFLEQNNIRFNSKVVYGEDALYILECLCSGAKISYDNTSWYIQREVNEVSITKKYDDRWFESNMVFLKESKRILENSDVSLTSEKIDIYIANALFNSIYLYLFFINKINNLQLQKEKLFLLNSKEFRKIIKNYNKNLIVLCKVKKPKNIIVGLILKKKLRIAMIIYKLFYWLKQYNFFGEKNSYTERLI